MAATRIPEVWLNETPAGRQNFDVAISGSEQVQFSSTASLPSPVRPPPVAALHQQRARLGGLLLTSVARVTWQGLCQCLGLTSGQNFQVAYSLHFMFYLAMVLMMVIYWVANYVLAVWPVIKAIDKQPCNPEDGHLTFYAKTIFIYLIWLAVARTSLFLPFFASRVAAVHYRSHGFCHTCLVYFIIRDGPLYIFVIGSTLFCLQVLRNPYCADGNLLMHQKTLRNSALSSSCVSVLCMFLVYWHNKLLMDAAQQRYPSQDRGTPPGTLEKMETRAYNEALFGDEEGKPYPSECAICLGTWDKDDVIKVTPCGHAFHEECLGGWFRNARTCALCRQDCSMAPVSSGPTDPVAAAGLAPGSATASSDHTFGSLVLVAEAAAVDEELDDLEAHLTGHLSNSQFAQIIEI